MLLFEISVSQPTLAAAGCSIFPASGLTRCNEDDFTWVGICSGCNRLSYGKKNVCRILSRLTIIIVRARSHRPGIIRSSLFVQFDVWSTWLFPFPRAYCGDKNSASTDVKTSCFERKIKSTKSQLESGHFFGKENPLAGLTIVSLDSPRGLLYIYFSFPKPIFDDF